MTIRAAVHGLRVIALLGCGLAALGFALPASAQTPTHVIWSDILWGMSGQGVRLDYAAVEPTMNLNRRQEEVCRHEVKAEIVDADSLRALASTGPTELVFGSLTLPYGILEDRKVLARLSIRFLPANNAAAGEIRAICQKRASLSLVNADGSLVAMIPAIITSPGAGGGPH